MAIQSKPAVSIVVSVKNGEEYICACFNAIARLTAPRDCFEVLLVDNDSTDRTVDLASVFENLFDLKIYCSHGASVSEVRNYGITRSSGKVIAFLDADCIVPPEWLEKWLAAFHLGLEKYRR